jgi:hypothetical protein
MNKTIKTLLLIAAAAVCISATPLAISYAPSTTAQKAAQTAGTNAAVAYRQKLDGCKKQANDSYLHFLQRMSFISECMSNS